MSYLIHNIVFYKKKKKKKKLKLLDFNRKYTRTYDDVNV